MPPPKELPGFYYDQEKNRYFPIKGPIPGSSSSSSAKLGPKKSIPRSTQERSSCRKPLKKTSKLLHARELNGNIVKSYRWKCNFKEELQKIQASQPVVWKYQGTDRIDISALEQINIDVETFEGVVKTDVLLSGNLNGSLRFFEVRKEQAIDVTSMPDCVKNYAKGKTYKHDEVPAPVIANCGLIGKPSRISCIRLGPKFSSQADDEGPTNGRHVLFTHLGSETSGGSVHIMDLAEPLMPNVISPIREVASFQCTFWTAEYDYTRPRAVIGTNNGAASVDLETGRISWFLRCKSDVFAEQIFNSGNSILCGLRNGAIIAIDSREKRNRLSSSRVTQRIPYPPLDKKAGSSNKEWFKLSGDMMYPSQTTRMPSSISSLVSLQSDDQYFLASSMDGSVRLYDHRLLQRGPVQSYEGHVNSHTRIQLGVDPHERFVMSGGEDCYLRLWSIKSGELLFEDKFSDSVLSTVCFRKYNYQDNVFNPNVVNKYMNDYPLGAWLASHGGFYYVNWFSL